MTSNKYDSKTFFILFIILPIGIQRVLSFNVNVVNTSQIITKKVSISSTTTLNANNNNNGIKLNSITKHIVQDVGITSLKQQKKQYEEEEEEEEEGKYFFYAGTKRGNLLQLEYCNKSHELIQKECITSKYLQAESIIDKIQLKPYPIYSMDVIINRNSEDDMNRNIILCGGGDRFVTLWQHQQFYTFPS